MTVNFKGIERTIEPVEGCNCFLLKGPKVNFGAMPAGRDGLYMVLNSKTNKVLGYIENRAGQFVETN
jgi:hypothetical protein